MWLASIGSDSPRPPDEADVFCILQNSGYDNYVFNEDNSLKIVNIYAQLRLTGSVVLRGVRTPCSHTNALAVAMQPLTLDLLGVPCTTLLWCYAGHSVSPGYPLLWMLSSTPLSSNTVSLHFLSFSGGWHWEDVSAPHRGCVGYRRRFQPAHSVHSRGHDAGRHLGPCAAALEPQGVQLR